MSDEKPTPPPRKRRARWVRVLSWLVILGVLGVIALGVAVGVAYKNRTLLTNRILKETLAAFDAQVGNIELSRESIEITDITVRDPKSAAVIATVRRVHWSPVWSKLHLGHLGRFILEDSKVDATAEQLRSWTAANATEPLEVANESGFKLPALVIDSYELKSASVILRGDDLTPSLRFTLNNTARGLDLTDMARPRLDRFSSRLTDLVVTIPKTSKEITLPYLDYEGGLDEATGMVVMDKLSLGRSKIKVTQELLRFAGLFRKRDAAEPVKTAAVPVVASPLFPWFKGVRVGKVEIAEMEFDATSRNTEMENSPLPVDVAFRLSYTLDKFEWRVGEKISAGPQQLDLTDIVVKPHEGGGQISVPRLLVESTRTDEAGRFQIENIELRSPRVEWTQSLENALLGGPPRAPPPPSTQRPYDLAHIGSLTIKDASITATVTKLSPIEAALAFDVEMENFGQREGVWESAWTQKLDVRGAKLSYPAGSGEKPKQPFCEMERVSLRLMPNDFRKDSRIEALTITKPVIRARDDTTPWFAFASSSSEKTTAPPANDAEALWRKLKFDLLQIDNGELEFSATINQPLRASAKLSLTTEVASDGKAPVHRIKITSIQGSLPTRAVLPIVGAESAEAAFRWPEILETHEFEELALKGGNVDVGDALMGLFDGSLGPDAPPPAPPAPPAPPPANADEACAPPPTNAPPDTVPAAVVPGAAAPAAKSNRWRSKKLSITGTSVTLQRIAPGLPPIRFDLDYEDTDAPLDITDLAGNIKPQKIELSGLTIPSVHNSLITVAKLETIFIHFTLDGILAQRIDKIEIVSPSLYVGEHLFWYVDYYRKFAAGEVVAGLEGPQVTAADKIAAIEAQAAQPGQPPPVASQAWSIDTLQVHSGKIFVAPKGTLLPGFSQPFPFSFTTKLISGEIEGELDIPADTYTLEQLKLELRGMRGKVQFNLPMKTTSNNLVQTFKLDQIRYKQLHVEEAFLSVTYDAAGIYGKFGGKAYEGYVEGAFNIYLDENYSWDGWLSGTGVKTTEVTRIMCPGYLLLDGKVDATVVAQGNVNELYQGDIKFKNKTPGHFSIEALDGLLKDYSAPGLSLTDQMTRIGLETTRDFAYDTVTGEGRFYGREGKGFLHFKGPLGSRNIDLNVYDHRWKVDPPKKPDAEQASE